MPKLDTLQVTLAPSISGVAGKSVQGSDYKGPSQSITLQRTFSFSSANANNAPLGADEFISYIFTIPGGTLGVIDLTALIDYLLQTGVSLTRIKSWRFNLVGQGQDSISGTACSKVTIGGPLPAPVQTALTTSAAGGSIPAGTYNYVITAITAAGETSISNMQTTPALTGSTNSVTLNWNSLAPSATGYKVYRSTTGTFGPSSLVGTVGSGSTLTFTDTLAAPTAGQPPATNTSQPLNPCLFNKTSGLAGDQLLNGDYQEYATASNNGWLVGTGTKVYITNNDQSTPPVAAAVQVTLVGGTT